MPEEIYMDFNPQERLLPDNLPYFEEPYRSRLVVLVGRALEVLSTPVRLHGIDVSHHNGDSIDFRAVKDSGNDFVIIKASEHTSFVDPQFERNWNEALANGLFVMPYHFFRGNYGGADQAKHAKDTVGLFFEASNYSKPTLWSDVETSDGVSLTRRQNRLKAFHETLDGNNIQSGYYSSLGKWNQLIGNVDWVSKWWQWVAHWTPNTSPSLPIGWTADKVKFWQYGIYPTYSWTQPVEGVGPVDVDWFYGTVEDLILFLGAEALVNCCEELKQEIVLLRDDIATLTYEVSSLWVDNERQDNHNLLQDHQMETMEYHIGQVTEDVLVINEKLKSIKEIL